MFFGTGWDGAQPLPVGLPNAAAFSKGNPLWLPVLL